MKSSRKIISISMATLMSAFVPVNYAYAATVSFVLGHGVQSNATSMNSIVGFARGAGVADIHNASYDWNGSSIASQANAMANAVINTPGEKVALVGHSMGGIRARQVVENNLYGNPKIAALVTIGAPNFGEAAINNGVTAIDVGAMLIWAGTVGLGTPVLPLVGVLRNSIDAFAGATKEELRPGSAMINNLNRAGGIPSSVYTVSIVGQNNDLRAWLPSVGVGSGVPDALGITSAGLAAILWANCWYAWWLVPLAILFSTAAGVMFGIQGVYNSIIGSDRHDILIPEDSQNLYQNGAAVGGRRLTLGSVGATEFLRNAYHTFKVVNWEAERDFAEVTHRRTQEIMQLVRQQLCGCP